jgi:hypothetical protein
MAAQRTENVEHRLQAARAVSDHRGGHVENDGISHLKVTPEARAKHVTIVRAEE